ncbi:MAG: ROK family protein [Woeseiaceae bacterium]|nr:ROK family protein [Woeseiaceae bacterium]
MKVDLGIDVGGTGIKGALVDIDTGELLSDRHRVETPQPATPETMAEAVRQLVSTFDYDGPVGCCFPTIVVDGHAKSVSNLDESWRGVQIDDTFAAATGLPFVVINDADAAGIAEMQLGAGKGLEGLVIMITIGTGLGSGMFYNGQLIPNSELGHMAGKDGEPFERYASKRARIDEELSWSEWGERFNAFLKRVDRVCSPDHLIIGGGTSKKFELFRDYITIPVPIHVARFLNNAGIIGAAVAAAQILQKD